MYSRESRVKVVWSARALGIDPITALSTAGFIVAEGLPIEEGAEQSAVLLPDDPFQHSRLGTVFSDP